MLVRDIGYNEKVVKLQILKARKFTMEDLLNQDSKTKGRNKLVFNFTYHPAYSKFKHILSNINLLTPDAQHRKIFPEVPIVGFKRGKSLKDLWVRAKVPVKKETWEILWLSGKTLQSLHFFRTKKHFH